MLGMIEKSTSNNVRTVIVPVANSATAVALLELAVTLAHPEIGRVLALVVSIGEAETEAEIVAKIEAILAKLDTKGRKVELVTRVATSVSRGILDVAREEDADLIVLGMHRRAPGEFALGSIVENVAATAPCDVLIYRPHSHPAFKHIIVSTDGSVEAQFACQIGVLLAKHLALDVEAVYAQENYHPSWEGRARIERTLDGIPGRESIKQTVITAGNPVAGVLARLEKDDLVVVGVSFRSKLERWLFGDFSQQLVNAAPGPVIVTAAQALNSGHGLAGQLQRSLNRFTFTLTRIEQDELVWQAQRMAAPSLDYFVLILIASVLASLGLVLNSAAVIIGAMLVAPLMQPLIALAIGLTAGRLDLVRRGMTTLALGVFTVLVVASLIGGLTCGQAPTTEILARGNPSWLDVVVALASGVAGAYAMARKDIPEALAGVAISAALIPLLCVTGLDLLAGSLGLWPSRRSVVSHQYYLHYACSVGCFSLARVTPASRRSRCATTLGAAGDSRVLCPVRHWCPPQL